MISIHMYVSSGLMFSSFLLWPLVLRVKCFFIINLPNAKGPVEFIALYCILLLGALHHVFLWLENLTPFAKSLLHCSRTRTSICCLVENNFYDKLPF